MPFIPREQLDRAKRIDLLTYLREHEPNELVRVSPNVYSTRSHDSLKISNGLWQQWSTGVGGRSALDYLIKIRGMSLPDAVLAINSGTVERSSFFHAREPPKAAVFNLPERNTSNSRVIAYLTERGIDRGVIDELIEQGRIYEERAHHNVVFVGADAEGTPRHAAMRATNSSRFMLDVQGSDKRYSFSITSETESAELHVFEGAIDLLSFCTLEKNSGVDWRAAHKLSLSGVSQRKDSAGLPPALKQFLADHPTVRRVALHLDNDPAGRNATGAIIEALPDCIECADQPPKGGKDFNDYLLHHTKTRERTDAR